MITYFLSKQNITSTLKSYHLHNMNSNLMDDVLNRRYIYINERPLLILINVQVKGGFECLLNTVNVTVVRYY